jgi:hypothetical protein
MADQSRRAEGAGRVLAGLVLLAAVAGCGGGRTTGNVTTTGTGGGSAPGACSDLFDQGVLQTYAVDISADEWAKLEDEFHDVNAVLAGTPRESYHPVTFHFGSETVTDAAIRLKGQSSWVETVTLDANPKMQFVIAFDQIDPKAKFHGVDKIRFDMPRGDWTFLNQRIAFTWLRSIGIMAPCANSARLNINGAYYGLYVTDSSVNGHLVEQFFPDNPSGDLFDGGWVAHTNQTAPNWARLQQFKDARDIAALQSIVDLESSVLSWAAEAALNDADGYYGGSHNFYLYDQGAKGYTWLPSDVDTTIEWIALFTPLSWKPHPIYWWEGRPFAQVPGKDYLIVMNDPTWRAHYVDAIATQIGKWDTNELLGWLDAWSAQIADAVAEDPHKWATADNVQTALAAARDVITNRPQYLQSFVACAQGQGGDDVDGDGVPWCNDCRDDDPAVHPGAPEICGNAIDDDCNGVVDDGC